MGCGAEQYAGEANERMRCFHCCTQWYDAGEVAIKNSPIPFGKHLGKAKWE